MPAEPAFDPVIHAPKRLNICAMLAPVDEVEFGVLRDELELSDSVLSKHLATLEEHDYIRLRKAKGLRRQQTWVALTWSGRNAYEGHVAELMRVVGMSAAARPQQPRPDVARE